jgi:hypothetical protein
MRILIGSLLVLLLSPLAIAGDRPAAEPAVVTAQMSAIADKLLAVGERDNRAYDIVKSLTTEVGPRPAGTAAEGRARDWAVAKLNSLGFQNVAVEPFQVPLWVRGVERAEIVAPFPQALIITALGGSAATGSQGVSGVVIRFTSLAELEAASPASVKDGIVFVDEPMARSRDGSGYGVAVQKRRATALAARRLGAVAALIRSVGTSSHRFAHTGQMRSIDYEADAGVPTAALAAADADQLRRTLAYGRPVTVKMVLTPELLPPAPSGNVLAEIIGREAPQEIVLVAAHLDSWDLGTGAVDDGAGVGIVVGAVKLLIDHLPQAPRRTIRVVLFGSEEVGIVGAKAYARRHVQELSDHIIATESDFGAGDIWRFDTGVGEGALGSMAAIGKVLEKLGIAPGHNNAAGGPDIRYLKEAGVPVVGLQQDGTDYFDLHHTADDTLDKITPDALRQNVAAYAALLYLLAETPVYFRQVQAPPSSVQ